MLMVSLANILLYMRKINIDGFIYIHIFIDIVTLKKMLAFLLLDEKN